MKFWGKFIKISAKNDETDRKMQNSAKISEKIREKSLTKIYYTFEFGTVQRYVNLADFEKC